MCDRCPVLLNLDLLALATHFRRLELMPCALGCVLLLPQPEQRISHTQQLLNDKGCVHLLEQLSEWLERGWAVPLKEQVWVKEGVVEEFFEENQALTTY